MLFANVHFLRPWWLLAWLPLLLIGWRLWRSSHSYSTWQVVCDKHLLPLLIEPSAQRVQKKRALGLMLAWIFAVLALAGPSWQQLPEAVYRAQHAKVIVLDLSPAIEATDLKPSRLARARYKILDLLARSQESQIGMVVFTDEAYVVSPLTQDGKTLAAMAPAINPGLMPVAGHNIGVALTKAAELFKQAEISRGQIILMTASKPTAADLAVAKKLKRQGFSISVLGVATTAGAPIPSTINDDQAPEMSKLASKELQQLAAMGGGRFAPFTSNDDDINTILAAAQTPTAALKQTTEAVAIWRDDGFWLILPLLLLVALLFRRGWYTEFTR